MPDGNHPENNNDFAGTTAKDTFLNDTPLDHYTLGTFPTPLDIDYLLQIVDVLQHFHTIQSCSSLLHPQYHLLHPTNHRQASILLQACSLKAQRFKYNATNPVLDQPLVYTSTTDSKLPIVIDTGASCSITPIISDFVNKLKTPDIANLNQLSGQTSVVGQGCSSWNVEDVNGIHRDLITDTYYVPSASIWLFFPQVYIDTDTTASFMLNHTGASLCLTCGTNFKFLSLNAPIFPLC